MKFLLSIILTFEIICNEIDISKKWAMSTSTSHEQTSSNFS